MIYVDFMNEVLDKLNKRYGCNNWSIKLYREGDTSMDVLELEFIHQTNMKYYGHSKDILDGDFIKMTKDSVGGGILICRFEVKYLYDEFNNKGWNQVFNIVDYNIKGIDKARIGTRNIDNYDEISNLIFVRPLNYEENKESLQGHVYRRIGDIVIALYMRVFEDKDNLTSFKIPKADVDKWGISEDQALDRAIQNSSVLYPAEIYISSGKLVEDVVVNIFVRPFDVEKDILEEMDTLMCTSIKGINGAAVFFYPGLKEKFYRAFGNEDYFVVFTATSEFHLHRCSDYDPGKLLQTLRNSNKQFPEEKLSDIIYRYYGDKNELLPVEQG
jgi:hypothetical protein